MLREEVCAVGCDDAAHDVVLLIHRCFYEYCSSITFLVFIYHNNNNNNDNNNNNNNNNNNTNSNNNNNNKPVTLESALPRPAFPAVTLESALPRPLS